MTQGNALVVASDGYYNAFPGFAIISNTEWMVVYRRGSAHLSIDGVIAAKRFNLLREGWDVQPVIIADDAMDCRDPSMTVLSDGRLALTFFKWDGATGFAPYLMISADDGATWTAETVIDTGLTAFAAIAAPVIEINGTLLAAVYGRNTGDARDSARILSSGDDGATWATKVIFANESLDYQEPNILRLTNGNILALFRTASTNVYRATSADGGDTWSTTEVAFAGTGNPHMIQKLDGTIYVFYRSNSGGDCVWRSSTDDGATWSAETVIDSDGTMMVYASPQLLIDGSIGLVYGMEGPSTGQPAEMRYVII